MVNKWKHFLLMNRMCNFSAVHAIFRDEDHQPRRPSRGAALSIASDNRSKKSPAAVTKSSVSSLLSKRASIAPVAAATERIVPVRGRDIQVSAF